MDVQKEKEVATGSRFLEVLENYKKENGITEKNKIILDDFKKHIAQFNFTKDEILSGLIAFGAKQ